MAAANQTSPDEDRSLAEHLHTCEACQDAYGHYLQTAAQLYEEAFSREFRIRPGSTEVSEQDALEKEAIRRRLLETSRGITQIPSAEGPVAISVKKKKLGILPLGRLPAWGTSVLAAALLIAVCVSSAQYWLSGRNSRNGEATSARLQIELEKLRDELVRIQNSQNKPTLEAPTKAVEKDFGKLRTDNQGLRQALANTEEARHRETLDNVASQQRIRLLESSLEVLRASNSNLELEKSGLAEKTLNLSAELRKSQDEMARLAARNDELSQESLAHVRSVDRQQKLLATDHDIRDILGARSLHIIDVFDVGSKGELERAFGRIFYTEGKSLIFYAFDLDQQKGLRRGTVFQAWGQKGEGKEDPHSLGAFYMDDPSQNRWVLKVDDGKLLSRIDYVFVTDGSRKEGVRPKGKPLLSAFLNTTVNHP